jgi:hypothetical protein
MLGDDEGIRTTEKEKYVAVHQVSDESDDDSAPPPRFERYRDIDDLPMDVDAGQDNDDEMDSVDSDYDDYNDILEWMIECLAYDLCIVDT